MFTGLSPGNWRIPKALLHPSKIDTGTPFRQSELQTSFVVNYSNHRPAPFDKPRVN
jgi:hypothetical protein